jgi:hypothetical protein
MKCWWILRLHKKNRSSVEVVGKREQLLQNIAINEMRRVILSHYCLKTEQKQVTNIKLENKV